MTSKQNKCGDSNDWINKIPINTLLEDIHKRFIAIKKEDMKHCFNVFNKIFNELLRVMGTVDNYFDRYSKKNQYAGSHYDKLKVGKPDEFDMDVVIRLPVSKSQDITLEAAKPGFVMVKMGEQFLNLRKKPDWESHHKVTDDWCDSKNYLLQSSLRKWIEATVNKALNKFVKNKYGEAIFRVDNVPYTVKCHKSGPAFTLYIRNRNDMNFKLDVDLVPVIEFELPMWPVGHKIPPTASKKKSWFIVPKPIKSITDKGVGDRLWRLSFLDQEREIIDGLYNMKPTVRLLKKLRDSLGLTKLASYYIKTLFLWESEKQPKEFWQKDFAFLFQHMLKVLHEALENKSIPFYWNRRFNLIGEFEGKLQDYKKKVIIVLDAIDKKNYLKLANSLLTKEEYEEFKNIKAVAQIHLECLPTEVSGRLRVKSLL